MESNGQYQKYIVFKLRNYYKRGNQWEKEKLIVIKNVRVMQCGQCSKWLLGKQCKHFTLRYDQSMYYVVFFNFKHQTPFFFQFPIYNYSFIHLLDSSLSTHSSITLTPFVQLYKLSSDFTLTLFILFSYICSLIHSQARQQWRQVTTDTNPTMKLTMSHLCSAPM